MFTDDELRKFADVKIWALKNARSYLGNGEMQKGDIVRLLFDREAMPLVEMVYERCIQEGWNVYTQLRNTPNMEKAFFDNADPDQLSWLAPWIVPPKDYHVQYDRDGISIGDSINGYIGIFAPEDLHHLENVDGDKIALHNKSTLKPFRDAIEPRETRGEFGWCLTIWPTEALAAEAGMTIDEYTREIVKACYLDSDDPVAEWEKLYQYTKKVSTWLKNMDIEYLKVLSCNCNLKVVIGDRRKWVSVSGHNIPSYETFTTPDCRFTEGVYYADKASLKDSNLVEGVRLSFNNGEVTGATAEKGQDYLQKMLDMDDGAVRIGEFSLTDRRFSRIKKFMGHTLYDENVGGENGNCHIALGCGFPGMVHDGDELSKEEQIELGYNDSALHWDLVNGEPKTVIAHLKDGGIRTIYEDGQFTMAAAITSDGVIDMRDI